jgi:hypothetical protein
VLRLALTVAAFTLTACADVCLRAELLGTSFHQRHQACFSPDTLPSPKVNEDVCDDSMNACTPQDEAAIHAYFDCLETLRVCTPETRGDFNEAFLGCAKGMNRLSEGCFKLE